MVGDANDYRKRDKNDLNDIKFYYENYEVFCNAVNLVGANKVVKTAEKYNEAMTYAPPRLYKLYLYLYCRRSSLILPHSAVLPLTMHINLIRCRRFPKSKWM